MEPTMPTTPTTGPLEWADHTWQELRDADLGRVVAILPVGAIEAHGPHLPLDTDVVIARAMAEAGAAALAARGRRAMLLPALPYTAAPFADGFAGTLSVAPETVTALLLDLARALARRGVAALAVANAHLDPAHLAAIAAAVARAQDERLLPIAAPDVSRKRWAPRLGDEFRSGACHAGRYEGSIVLAARPGAVRDAIARTLPPNPASLSDAVRAGKRSFEDAGGARAYFGAPAEATAEEGRETIARLGAILCEAVEESLAEGGA
jgi:creatinine amidohydrolase